jgi:transcription termination/antitermination protein NusG
VSTEPVDDDDEYQGDVAPIEEIHEEEVEEELSFDWYILKVQVNRENSICDALRRRVAREGLDEHFREIVVPTEDVVEFTKSGKKRTVKKKLYPGYIMVNMALTEETWFLVRETSGIGDFTGSAGKPTPMDPEEVRRIIKVKDADEEGEEEVRIAIPFNVGDRIRVKEGYFQNFEGDVESIDSANGRVTVMINIFGRSTPVELQHWQMERV